MCQQLLAHQTGTPPCLLQSEYMLPVLSQFTRMLAWEAPPRRFWTWWCGGMNGRDMVVLGFSIAFNLWCALCRVEMQYAILLAVRCAQEKPLLRCSRVQPSAACSPHPSQ